MNKSQKPAAPARQTPQPLTPEQKKEMMIKAYIQKKASLAEGILFNLCQSCGRDMVFDAQSPVSTDNHIRLVKLADEMSTEFMKVVYHQEVRPDESKNEEEEAE